MDAPCVRSHIPLLRCKSCRRYMCKYLLVTGSVALFFLLSSLSFITGLLDSEKRPLRKKTIILQSSQWLPGNNNACDYITRFLFIHCIISPFSVLFLRDFLKKKKTKTTKFVWTLLRSRSCQAGAKLKNCDLLRAIQTNRDTVGNAWAKKRILLLLADIHLVSTRRTKGKWLSIHFER